jgi:hypothetical protein
MILWPCLTNAFGVIFYCSSGSGSLSVTSAVQPATDSWLVTPAAVKKKKKTSKEAPKPSPKCQKYPPKDYWSGLKNSYFFFPFFLCCSVGRLQVQRWVPFFLH